MPAPTPRRKAALLGVVLTWLAWPDVAGAQESHGGQGPLPTPEILSGITHGIVQGTAVFLAGLVAFVALIWLPTNRSGGSPRGEDSFVRAVWALVGVLAVAGVADVCVYTVRANGVALTFGLFMEGMFGTQVGQVSLARLGIGLLVALLASWAAQQQGPGRWWVAAGAGGLLLAAIVPESHAVAQGFLAVLSIWFHLVAAAFWMGGLLAFPVLLLGPLGALELEERMDLRQRVVQRFSKVATAAVMAIIITGLHAALLNVSGPLALIVTSYGRALIMKLGMLVLLLAAGGINFIDKGRGPLGRMVGLELILSAGIFVAAGFLTSLPPAN